MAYKAALQAATLMDPEDRYQVINMTTRMQVPHYAFSDVDKDKFNSYVEHRSNTARNSPDEFMADLAGTFGSRTNESV